MSSHASNHIEKRVEKTLAGINIRPVSAYFNDSEESIHVRLRQLSLITEFADYEIACSLYVVKEKEYWKNPTYCLKGGPYPSYYSWIYSELRMSSRKARYLRASAEKLYKLGASSETIKEIFLLGWHKAYQILRVADNLQSLKRWQETAECMQESDLVRTVRLAIAFDPTKVQEAEKSGEVIDGVLADSIVETINWTDSTKYVLYKKGRNKLESRMGPLSNEEAMAVVWSHFLSTAFPGDGFTEVPREIEHKILEFQKAVEQEYGVKLSIGVSYDTGTVSGD